MPSPRPGVKIQKDPSELAGLEDRLYTTREVAEIFEMSEYQVRAWIRSGKLKAIMGKTKDGHRISRQSLVEFALDRYKLR